jgi:CelD/BcsL family acetyltransferase involved in cellulose biosynthesis
MELPEATDGLEAQLKRNVTESIRRSTNRLRRDGVDWRFDVVEQPGPRLDAAVEELVSLHSARAGADDRFPHTDYFAEPDQSAFLRDASAAMADAGHLKVCSLAVDGEAIASLLILRANGGVFFSVSGMNPAWWDYGVMTLLQRECLRDAIASGDRLVNLSRGPNAPKLRWAENLEIHHNFNLVAGQKRSRRLFSVYAPYRTLAEFRMRATQRAAKRKLPADA